MENNTLKTQAVGNPSVIDKIIDLSSLGDVLSKRKKAGQKIVHCHGVFDLMHPGHIRHLAEAKSQGDLLVVTITADAYVNKGPGRPVFTALLRAETLASLASVDYVAINDAKTAIDAIKVIRPNIYVKGSDYADPSDDLTGKIVDEEETVKTVGGRIHFTDDITFSSSALINQNFHSFPTETEAWLRGFRKSYFEKDVLNALDSIKDLKLLILGEAIIDEYVFCSGLGKVAKDPILAFLHEQTETYVGGSFAVANHLGDFCESVEIVTLVGEIERHEDFLRSSLHPNVNWHPVTQAAAPTLRKTRYVDDDTGSKIFEIYHMDDDPLPVEIEEKLLTTIAAQLESADVVIVADYGHGMMTPAVIDLVTKKSKFLAINTQANAGNRGFNLVSKYPRADYVCLAGHEMELETRRRHGSWKEKLDELALRIDSPCFTVTIGVAGSIHHHDGGKFTQAPALAPKVVDRVGAGDAVLAITAVLAAVKTPWEILAMIGNAAGARMVSDLGNRVSLSKSGLSKQLVALMKQ